MPRCIQLLVIVGVLFGLCGPTSTLNAGWWPFSKKQDHKAATVKEAKTKKALPEDQAKRSWFRRRSSPEDTGASDLKSAKALLREQRGVEKRQRRHQAKIQRDLKRRSRAMKKSNPRRKSWFSRNRRSDDFFIPE